MTFECPHCRTAVTLLSKAFPYCSPTCRKVARAAKKKKEALAQAQKRGANARRSPSPLKSFYQTQDWLLLRHEALRIGGGVCVLCGLAPRQGVSLAVDHIKPRSTHPELSLALSNLQVLCSACNSGKRNYDDTDWRGR